MGARIYQIQVYFSAHFYRMNRKRIYSLTSRKSKKKERWDKEEEIGDMNRKIKLSIGLSAVLCVFFLLLLLPAFIVLQGRSPESPPNVKISQPIESQIKKEEAAVEVDSEQEQVITVYRANQETVENVDLNDYVFGVLAGEMPASFEMEALKAQAVAARTYIAQLVSQNGGKSDLPEGADVTDTVQHQVYYSNAELKKLWAADYQWKAEKIRQAVEETDNLILTYENRPIHALFFSTSNGYTEHAEYYWKNPFPYLKSVKSPWDLDSPKYLKEQTFTLDDFNKKLEVSVKPGQKLLSSVKRTPGQAIASVKIGGVVFTGRKVREQLGLASADFSMKWQGKKIVVTTKGYGHQVGMSQYGANGMAKNGKTFEEILLYYYQGVTLEPGLSFFVDGKI